MRFFCKQEEFIKALNMAGKAIDSQSTLPVLSNILLNGENQKLEIFATNLEISIKVAIDVDLKNEGKITVPSRMLTSWVNFIKGGEIEVKTEENETITLKTAEAKTKIKGMSAEEFPTMPQVDKICEFKTKVIDLKKSINEVVFSCAHSSVRPVLSGLLLHGKNKEIFLVATDSYRLGEKKIILEEKLEKELYSIIPARTMIELERILSTFKNKEEEVKVIICDNQIEFLIDNIKITSRLIEGKFPEYDQIIPKSSQTDVLVKKDDFTLALKRVGLFAKENNNNIKFSFQDNQMSITTNETEIGSESTNLSIEMTGKENQISLNGQFLLDVLSVISDEEVKIKITEKLSPAIILGKNQENFIHVIMPVKV